MPEQPVADLRDLYRDRFPEGELEAKRKIWDVLCRHYFSRFIRPTDTVMDIACGYGEFINQIPCGRRIAVDLNDDVQSHLADGVEFYNQSCESLDCVENDSVDCAFESNMFEHLPDKTVLRNVVSEVRTKLRPGGRFIMMQPNILYVGDAYWDFYDHLIPLSHLSCVELLRNCGYIPEVVVPRFLPYTTKSAIPQHPALVRAYLMCPPAWRVLGKQFVIVARKPDDSTPTARTGDS